jgi:hypothetical protein
MELKNLDLSLLYRILSRVGEFREEHPSLLQTVDLLDLVPDVAKEHGEQQALFYLERHVIHLQERGYLRSSTARLPGSGLRVLQLSSQGEMFVQPELAEFGREPMLPQVMRSLEHNIQVLTYSEAEKESMFYRLREAMASQAPDVIAKVITEVGVAIIKAQM